jgi:hypothetical protein
MCQKNHYLMQTAAREKLSAVLERLVANRDEHFGNARLVRNLFELAIRRMAVRIANIAPLTRELLTTLEREDIASQAGELPTQGDAPI